MTPGHSYSLAGRAPSCLTVDAGAGAEAGDGAGGYPQYGLDSSCPEGVDQNTALLATAAAIAVGAGVIYRAVTLQQAGRRRRRGVDSSPSLTSRLQDIIMMGQSSSYLSLNISAFV